MATAAEVLSGASPPHVKDVRRAFTWHLLVVAIASFVALFSRFLRPSFYALFEDDFYYYALIAKNIALHHRSTFDGTHLTNGYHPLWMMVVAACAWLFRGAGFFLAMQGVALVAIIIYYFGVLRCLHVFSVPAPVERLAALVLSLHALLLFRYGMEVTLALPLGVWTLAYIADPGFCWSRSQSLRYGLLASLTILARLDSVLLVALLLAAQMLLTPAAWPLRCKRLVLYLCGWLPFFLYLALNLTRFHALLPVSGSAKQLKTLWPPSFVPLQSLFLPVDRTKLAFVYPVVLLVAVALLARALRGRRSAGQPLAPPRALLVALLLFPAVHLSVLCLLSDWTVWPWYYYSLCYAALAAVTLLLTRLAGDRIRAARLVFTAYAVLLCLYVGSYALWKRPSDLLPRVAAFARDHPGTYAMGDGSGIPAFLSGQPFVQLEGLTMDAQYLDLVRRQTPLRSALETYHAGYYVILHKRTDTRCLPVGEPGQAGPHSPRMPGRVCAPALQRFEDGNTEAAIFKASDVLMPSQ